MQKVNLFADVNENEMCTWFQVKLDPGAQIIVPRLFLFPSLDSVSSSFFLSFIPRNASSWRRDNAS